MNENLHIIIIHIFFLVCALSGYIFVNPFTSCVPDRYQYKQCIIMETETETNMKNLHVFRFYWLCVQLVIFSLNLLFLVLLIIICPRNTLLCRPLRLRVGVDRINYSQNSVGVA